MTKALMTKRLVLLPLCARLHYGAMRRMRADANVMRYITGHPETAAQTAAWLGKVELRREQQGHSWWAIQFEGDVVGAATLQRLASEDGAPFEIGWRLPTSCQGRGFASEAAERLLKLAGASGIEQVLAVAAHENLASIAVMRRLGMVDLGTQIHYGRPLATYRWCLVA